MKCSPQKGFFSPKDIWPKISNTHTHTKQTNKQTHKSTKQNNTKQYKTKQNKAQQNKTKQKQITKHKKANTNPTNNSTLITAFFFFLTHIFLHFIIDNMFKIFNLASCTWTEFIFSSFLTMAAKSDNYLASIVSSFHWSKRNMQA